MCFIFNTRLKAACWHDCFSLRWTQSHSMSRYITERDTHTIIYIDLNCEQHSSVYPHLGPSQGLKTANHPEAIDKYYLPYHHIDNSEKSISFEVEINKNNAVENCANYTKNG